MLGVYAARTVLVNLKIKHLNCIEIKAFIEKGNIEIQTLVLWNILALIKVPLKNENNGIRIQFSTSFK